MNAEVSVEMADGKVLKYSITPDGDVYEIRSTGWRKIEHEELRSAILFQLAVEKTRFDA